MFGGGGGEEKEVVSNKKYNDEEQKKTKKMADTDRHNRVVLIEKGWKGKQQREIQRISRIFSQSVCLI